MIIINTLSANKWNKIAKITWKMILVILWMEFRWHKFWDWHRKHCFYSINGYSASPMNIQFCRRYRCFNTHNNDPIISSSYNIFTITIAASLCINFFHEKRTYTNTVNVERIVRCWWGNFSFAHFPHNFCIYFTQPNAYCCLLWPILRTKRKLWTNQQT